MLGRLKEQSPKKPNVRTGATKLAFQILHSVKKKNIDISNYFFLTKQKASFFSEGYLKKDDIL